MLLHCCSHPPLLVKHSLISKVNKSCLLHEHQFCVKCITTIASVVVTIKAVTIIACAEIAAGCVGTHLCASRAVLATFISL